MGEHKQIIPVIGKIIDLPSILILKPAHAEDQALEA
jgi:hypothetical protein